MKSKLLSAFLLAAMWLMGTSVQAQLSKNESGAYLIGSKADLLTWSKIAGYEKTNAVLTADIENLDFRMATTTGYSGTFDGDGHTITVNFNFPGEATGMFVKASGATVKNLIVKGEIEATYKNTAAVVADGSGTFENLLVDVNMHNDIGANASNAAIVGYGRGTTFNNCVAILKVDGRDQYNCGFVGWVGNGQTATANNCISIVETDLANAFSFGNPQGQFGCNNCFAFQQDKDDTMKDGVTYIADNSILTSGEMCYILNKGAGKTVFYQNLGEDPYPVPFASHKEVFGIGNKRCDGTVLDGDLTYSNENVSPTPQHDDVDGWCSVCGNLIQEHLTPDAEGFYPLATAADVKWFTALVNDLHQTTVKAKLTADIDFEGVENAHRPIGPNTTYKYNGVFDGQGHRIKGMVLSLAQNGVGFFGFVRGGTIIRNLIIDSSCQVSGNGNVGALIGSVQTNAGTPLTIENCVNEATVTGTGSASGIIGAGQSAYPSVKMVNCLNTGEITGKPATAFCSWLNAGNSSVTNCVNTGIINGMDNAGGKFGYLCNLFRYEPGTLTMTNCFDLSGMRDMEGMEEVGQGFDYEYETGYTTEDPARSGELCYLLNGDQSTISWYQVLGQDEVPYPFYAEGGRVYANGDVLCDGTPTGDVSYGNTQEGTVPDHEFEDGFCLNCGKPDMNYAPVVDGYHCISTASQMYWLSLMVNDYGYKDMNVRLTEDIDMEEYSDLFQPIGNSTNQYCGHFDGQGHKLSNLVMDWSGNYVGVFGLVSGGTVIENFILDETCSISTYGECIALVGGANTAGNITLRNLGNMGNISATSKQAAGIFGGNTGSRASLVIENCFSTGSISGSTECAALVGWGGSNSPAIRNSWSCAEVTGNDRADMWLVRHGSGQFSGLYATQGEQGAIIEYDIIETGELCYRLNGDQTSITWYQNIDNGEEQDYQPVPFSNGHARVYAKGKVLCDGSVDPSSMEYSNSNEAADVPDHDFHDGFCTVCGMEDEEFQFVKGIKNADFNVDNFGWEGTGLAVANGVASQTDKTFDSYQSVAGLQPGVYRLRVQGYSRSAAIDNEEIYGEGELSEENDILRNTYIYAENNGQRVARRLMDITADAQDYKLNDGMDETLLPNEKYVPATNAVAAKYFAKGKYWNDLYFAVSADTVRLGFSNQINSTKCQSIIDRLRLIYVGNDDEAYALIAQQITDDAQQLEYLEGQEPVKVEYADVIEGAESLSGAEDILAAADKTARYPDIIKLSVNAYAEYYAVIAEINAYWEANNDNLVGEAAERLEAYLTEEAEPSEEFPNGTYQYIKQYREIGIEDLEAEKTFAKQLLQNAIKGSTAEGMDITSLMANAKFDEGNWNGWNVEIADTKNGNIVDNSGFTDVFPVAAGYNSTFQVSQVLTDLPNGIYELEANAYHRPGEGRAGSWESLDVIPAKLFLNNYATPIRSVYSDGLDYSDAINGVNCRFDATEDPEAPHNGEQTGSKDLDIEGVGLIPDNTYTASFAFNGGRYVNHAYAIVTDGQLTIGVRNGATPWRAKNHTVWGGFKLTYHGTSAQAISDVLEQYAQRLELLEIQHYDMDYRFSQSHVSNIETLLAQAQTGSVEKKMECISRINDEFNAIEPSHEIYNKLLELYEYAMDMSQALPAGETKDFMDNLYQELNDVIVEGSYTDEEAEAKIAELMENPNFGNVIYVQGDLYDENSENGAWNYSSMCALYPLHKNAEGKWVGSVTLQDRSRRANADQRAGVYFRRINTIYKAADGDRRFITPAHNSLALAEGSTADFQALNGTYNITLDLEEMTVNFTQTDAYNWDNQVYVTGTLKNREGNTTRWQNSEQWPLQHVGNGKYVGTVEMVNDNSNNFCSFGIIACRSVVDMVNYSQTARSSWTEARYGSSEQYLNIKSGEKVDSLVRGLDRTWRISPAGKYLIEFDMNNSTMTATLLQTKGNGTEADPFLIANAADLQSMQDRMVDGKTTYFKLTEDIDLQGEGWYPLNSTFFGNSYECGYGKQVSLDGDNHIIKNVTIANNADNDSETGFFAALCGSVSNLGMYNVTNQSQISSASGVLAGKLGSEEYDGIVTVENSYFHGTVNAANIGGGIAGTAEGTALIDNCYANAKVYGQGIMGDLVGQASGSLTVQNSYAAGLVNGSEATAAIGDGNATQSNVLYYNGQNLSTVASTVSAWTGWTRGNEFTQGFPVLLWQVQHADGCLYSGFCSEEMIDSIESVNKATSLQDNEAIYNLAGQRVTKAQKGIFIQNGKKILK